MTGDCQARFRENVGVRFPCVTQLAEILNDIKSSNLNSYFSNSLSSTAFFHSLNEEVANYINLMQKKGSTIQLDFDEDQVVLIDNSGLSKLLVDVTKDNYSLAVVSYICDCLTLGEKVEYSNEMIKEITFDLADPEINDSLSKETIETILNLLK